MTISRHRHTYLIHDPGGHIGIPIAAGRPYESKMLDHIYGLGLTGTALDVGAHVGNHALFLAAVCGLAVHAWEPGDRQYRMLVANIAANPTLDGRLHAQHLAAGDMPGTGTLNRLMQMIPGDGPACIARVDDVHDFDDLAVVKIDVEGGEPAALRGMAGHLRRCSPVVYTEVHGRSAHRAQIAVLEPLGYQETARIKMGSLMLEWRR